MGKKKNIPPEGIPESITVTDTLDLHGFFPEQVPEIVDAFIDNALHLGLIKVWIIHGKGKSRLKFEVYECLRQSPFVIRFYDALPDSGGWGKTVVELSDMGGKGEGTE